MDDTYLRQLKRLIEEREYPRYLYKYRAINKNNLNAILNHQLWFSCGVAFNDPFEGRVKLAKSYSFDEMARYVFWQTGVLGDYKIFSELDHKRLTREIWDYVYHPEKWNKQFKGIIDSNYLKTRICSLSNVCDNILMWSHYAPFLL